LQPGRNNAFERGRICWTAKDGVRVVSSNRIDQ
jgi:hypothetical protein